MNPDAARVQDVELPVEPHEQDERIDLAEHPTHRAEAGRGQEADEDGAQSVRQDQPPAGRMGRRAVHRDHGHDAEVGEQYPVHRQELRATGRGADWAGRTDRYSHPAVRYHS